MLWTSSEYQGGEHCTLSPKETMLLDSDKIDIRIKMWLTTCYGIQAYPAGRDA